MATTPTWGPAPSDVVDRLRQQPDPIIAVRGNTDRMIATGDDTVARWAADQLGAERVEWLRLLPERETIAEHHATLVPATPRSDEECPSTPDFRAEAMLVAVHTTLLLCGHIHVQYRRQVGDVEIVNPGSVVLRRPDERGVGNRRRRHYQVAPDRVRHRARPCATRRSSNPSRTGPDRAQTSHRTLLTVSGILGGT